MATMVKITDGGVEYPFIRMENVWDLMNQKYVYEDSGEKTISVELAILVEGA